jgi:hypothetical protein
VSAPQGEPQDERPDWRGMTALEFTTAPQVTQPALFATGTDACGTGSLLGESDELHLF